MTKVRGLRERGAVRVFFPKDAEGAQQHFTASVDINNIVKMYMKHGDLPHGTERESFYADVSDAGDYRHARQSVLRGEAIFSRLPASVRERFRNDPAQYLLFAADASNEKDLVKMGLIKPVKKAVKPVEVVPAGVPPVVVPEVPVEVPKVVAEPPVEVSKPPV